MQLPIGTDLAQIADQVPHEVPAQQEDIMCSAASLLHA
jgi:hypothetical protein